VLAHSWRGAGVVVCDVAVCHRIRTGRRIQPVHIVWPRQDLIPAVVDWFTPTGPAQLLWLLELGMFLALAVWVLLNKNAATWERLAAAGGLLLVSVLSRYVLIDPAHFRQMGELWAVYWLVILRLAGHRGRAAAAGLSVTLTVGVIGLIVTG
jgi:hypothetical protein